MDDVVRRGGPVRILAALVPRDERDVVLGDLGEEGLRAGSVAWAGAILGIALHVHAEAWRDAGARLAALATLVAGLGILVAVRAAGWGADPPVEAFGDPFSRLALTFWGTRELTSALAAGLVVGHAPWATGAAGPSRWHAALLLAGATALFPVADSSRWLPALALLSAAWVGDRGRAPGQAQAVGPQGTSPPSRRSQV